MKRFFAILILLLCAIRCEAQVVASSNITAVITVTNFVTNGYFIQINSGPSREWTNYVSNPSSQIQTTNSTNATATNLWLSLANYPNTSPFVSAYMTNSNVVVLTSINGQGLTITTNASGNPGLSSTNNWCSILLFTNFFTNATAVRVPTNAVGVTEASNVAAGIFGYLNSPYLTNINNPSYAVNSSLNQWSNFVNATALAALSNFCKTLSTNNTNYSFTLWQNGSNFTWNEATNSTNFTTNFATNCYINNSNYTYNASNYLWTLFDPLFVSGKGYLDSSGDAVLSNTYSGTFTAQRLFLQQNGNASPSDGGTWFLYGSGGVNILQRGDTDGDQFIMDAQDQAQSPGHGRFETDDQRSGTSNTYIRGGAQLTLANNGPNVGGGYPIGAGIAVSGQNGILYAARPVVFQNVTAPSVAIGTFTNFASLSLPSGAATYHNALLAGDSFTNSGDTLIRTLGIKFATGGTFDIAVQFNGNTIIDSGSVVALSGGCLSFTCEVTKGSGTTYYWNSYGTGSLLSSNTFSSVGTGTITGGTTNSVIDVITDPTINYAVIYVDNVKLAPSVNWVTLP